MSDKYIKGHWDSMSEKERLLYLEARSYQLMIRAIALCIVILILSIFSFATYSEYHAPDTTVEDAKLLQIEALKDQRTSCMNLCDEYFKTSVESKVKCISSCQ